MRAAVWGLLLLCVCKLTEALPAPSLQPTHSTSQASTLAGPTEDESAELVDWLSRYGYLPPADPNTGQLQAWTAVTQAIKAMQNFAGLKETGVVDEETLSLMRAPRCSLPDEDEELNARTPNRTAGQHLREKRRVFSTWTRKNINWRLRSYPTSSVLSREMIRSLVYYALRVWAEPTPLEFHEVGSSGLADLLVDFLHGSHGDGFPFDGAGGAVGHAFFPSDPERAGSVHLDSEENWAFRQPASEGTDLFTVLVHEFGHALGLSHTSSRRSVMRPYYQGPVGDPLLFSLSSQDRELVTRLYGRQDHLPVEDSPELVLQPHVRHRGHWVTENLSNTIDRCATSFDAVAQIRGETFFFKGLSMWRVSAGGLVSGKAASLRRMWGGLPPNMPPLQAVLERHSDHAILFITDSQYWVFRDRSLQEGYPRPLSELGGGGKGVECGLVWNVEKGPDWGDKNGETDGTGENSIWKELIRDGVNGITTENNGSIYVFRGHLYWKFSSPGSAPEVGFPRSLASDWLDCPQPSPSVSGALSYSVPVGKQEFSVIQKEQEKEQGNDDKRHVGSHGRKTGVKTSDREQDRLGQWSCPCLNSGKQRVDLIQHQIVLLLLILLIL